MPAHSRRADTRTLVQWRGVEKGTWWPAAALAKGMPSPSNLGGGLIMTRKRYLARIVVAKAVQRLAPTAVGIAGSYCLDPVNLLMHQLPLPPCAIPGINNLDKNSRQIIEPQWVTRKNLINNHLRVKFLHSPKAATTAMTLADLHELPDSIFKDQRFPGAFFLSNTPKALGLDATVPPVWAYVKLRKYMYHRACCGTQALDLRRVVIFLATQISWSSAQASFLRLGKAGFVT